VQGQQKVNTLTKSIKEKENLIKISLALGMEPDPKLVREVTEYRDLLKNIKAVGEEFNDFISSVKNLKVEPEPVVEEIKPIKTIDIPKPPTVEELLMEFAEPEETKEQEQIREVIDVPKPPTVEELLTSLGVVEDEEEFENTLVNLAAKQIEKEAKLEEKSTFAQPDVPIENTVNDLRKKVKFLEDWLAKVSALGPGSGEVNLLNLDDVDKTSIADNKYLRYNSANAKIEFADVSGGGSANVDLTAVSSNIVPTANSVFNLGAPDLRFKTLYLANNTIDLGGALIQSDGTGAITISGSGAVLPTGSKIRTSAEREQSIALVSNTGSVVTVVPFYTQTGGLNTIAANFEFGANPDNFVFTNFTLNGGESIQQAAVAQFYF